MQPGALSRFPTTLLLAAGAAILIAATDAVSTLLHVLADRAGAIFGTLLRDALLVLGAVMVLRPAKWAGWLLAFLFAATLVRVMVADELLELTGIALAVVGLVVLFLPQSWAWWMKTKAA